MLHTLGRFSKLHYSTAERVAVLKIGGIGTGLLRAFRISSTSCSNRAFFFRSEPRFDEPYRKRLRITFLAGQSSVCTKRRAKAGTTWRRLRSPRRQLVQSLQHSGQGGRNPRLQKPRQNRKPARGCYQMTFPSEDSCRPTKARAEKGLSAHPDWRPAARDPTGGFNQSKSSTW